MILRKALRAADAQISLRLHEVQKVASNPSVVAFAGCLATFMVFQSLGLLCDRNFSNQVTCLVSRAFLRVQLSILQAEVHAEEGNLW